MLTAGRGARGRGGRRRRRALRGVAGAQRLKQTAAPQVELPARLELAPCIRGTPRVREVGEARARSAQIWARAAGRVRTPGGACWSDSRRAQRPRWNARRRTQARFSWRGLTMWCTRASLQCQHSIRSAIARRKLNSVSPPIGYQAEPSGPRRSSNRYPFLNHSARTAMFGPQTLVGSQGPSSRVGSVRPNTGAKANPFQDPIRPASRPTSGGCPPPTRRTGDGASAAERSCTSQSTSGTASSSLKTARSPSDLAPSPVEGSVLAPARLLRMTNGRRSAKDLAMRDESSSL